jgi:methylglutaconyl-CoA hydratase
MDRMIDARIAEIVTSAPGAVAGVRKLIAGIRAHTFETVADFVIETTAEARAGVEGQAGMKAFLQREKPPWTIE